ncbi:MAG: DUF2061 domain-containing protein [Verrucomicrobia bacterium]|jgi:uncharacterized membrane protein|nr:DUF2061 domain-containing protein [Verrucomicrobiota bacterium]MDB4746235.1 DUF2061 domain-containing protein [Verrucomicrobiota bacterium]
MKNGRKQDRESHVRSLLKGLSWRVLATGTTILIAWITTDDVSLALKIGGIEFFAKFFIYYLHERAWLFVPSGAIRKLYGGQSNGA